MEKLLLSADGAVEHGSREWGVINPMQDDKVSMFGTPQKPGTGDHKVRASLLDAMRLEPRRRH